ncbi:uncharacterized protein EV422DRAFT_513435 [Fimicolochytrium jonesii]|uniref:uncharacterized protein n=1 Tax=Fimicolochytrium jonesii TaxID=1396493 RepID=UPI0022FE8CA2|nr:uncharacterized protein EV422DRAFT_513435 [Fimicolochytrium jonesii]KAI8825587.1 hypothetical protein EV422DRAFT_513435 [Fimicolochytrium jonesii]
MSQTTTRYVFLRTTALLILALATATADALPLVERAVAEEGAAAAAAAEGGSGGTWWKILVIAGLVAIGGLVAGLTLGLMSLDETDLRILLSAGTPAEKRAAARIAPIRKNGHLLLVTLLIVNAVINETLPILLDEVAGGGWQAILISTVLVLVAGEIIPQAACSRYGLQIGAFFVWPVRIMIYAMFIIAWPISKLLDAILGAGHGAIYKKSQLTELVALHGPEEGNALTHDEVKILQGALNVHEKTIEEIMTPFDKVYMLSSDTKLDRETMLDMLRKGHSRIPIYKEHRTNVVGILLVKSIILEDPSKAVPISSVRLITQFPRLKPDTPLLDVLNTFQEGASHMAFVTDLKGADFVGIVTLEDVVEEIIQEEIVDETDVFASNSDTKPLVRPKTLVKLAGALLKRNSVNNRDTYSATSSGQQHPRANSAPLSKSRNETAPHASTAALLPAANESTNTIPTSSTTAISPARTSLTATKAKPSTKLPLPATPTHTPTAPPPKVIGWRREKRRAHSDPEAGMPMSVISPSDYANRSSPLRGEVTSSEDGVDGSREVTRDGRILHARETVAEPEEHHEKSDKDGNIHTNGGV